jgi:hypothetical protein
MMFGTWGTSNTGIGTGKGTLVFTDDRECPICLETKRCVSQPRCDHVVCTDCFKRCYYGRPYPPFPYPDVEQDYYDAVDRSTYLNNPEWDEYREKIDGYEREYDATEEKNHNGEERHLRQCPLCRK